MWEWRTDLGWADVAVWSVLAGVFLMLVMAAWWPTRNGNGA
jgi:hypothetical protein